MNSRISDIGLDNLFPIHLGKIHHWVSTARTGSRVVRKIVVYGLKEFFYFFLREIV